jgi:uncharacterized membrane protein
MSPSSTDPRARCERGQAAVELAVVLPLLLIILLGVIEFGRAFEVRHALSGMSREAANLAARGTSLTQAVTVTMANGADISLDRHGGVVASQIGITNGNAVVQQQQTSAGYAAKSRIGAKGARVTGIAVSSLTTGESRYVVEIFYDHSPVTPFAALTRIVFPEEVYARAVF